MKFRRGTSTNLVSECGEYSVAKVIFDGVAQYEAWHTPKGAPRAIAIANKLPTSLDAIGACRRFAQTPGKHAS